MQVVTTIGLDIAKSVFQVHGIDAEGKVLIRRKLKRRYVLAFFQKLPPCLVGIGTRSAEGIMASGHANRANRPNTWLHRPATRREVLTCQPGAVHTWH
jgi:hypothetical protein